MNSYSRDSWGVIRFFLASAVVLGHFGELTKDSRLFSNFPFSISVMAVTIFFVLSGYFAIPSFERSITVKAYFKKRWLRIYPAYGAIVLFFFCCSFVITELPFKDYIFDFKVWKYLVVNMLFQNYLQPTLPGVFEDNYINVINGSLWTMKVEISFFLIVPYIIWISNKFVRLTPYLYLIFIIISLIIRGIISNADLLGWPILAFLEKQLPGQFLLFVLGMFMYDFHTNKVNKLWALIILFLVAVLGWFWCGIIPYYLIITFFCYLFATKVRLGAIDKILGGLSYPMYLIHFPLIQIFIFFCHHQRFTIEVLFGFIVSLLVLSYLFHRFIEVNFELKK